MNSLYCPRCGHSWLDGKHPDSGCIKCTTGPCAYKGDPMNDEHDNAQTDKEMRELYNPAHVRAYTDEKAQKMGAQRRYVGPWPDQEKQSGGVVRPNPIHTDRSVQHIDVRMYFDKEMDEQTLLDKISSTLQGDAYCLADLISAYQLKNNGFGHLLPEDKPLA